MQIAHPFHLELRHATIPTYIVSYVFPVLFVLYEIYRVGAWIAMQGFHFAAFKEMGYEYLLMLTVFAIQLAVQAAFLAWTWLGRHPDLEHRLGNLTLGLLVSAGVLAFDYALQVAF